MSAGGILALVLGAALATALITWLVVDRVRRERAARAVAVVETRVEELRGEALEGERARTDAGAWDKFKERFGRRSPP